MSMTDPTPRDLLGRIAYIDPSRQWGFLHGPHGERVYFHTTGVRGSIAELAPGASVNYSLADGGDPLCAVQLAAIPQGV